MKSKQINKILLFLVLGSFWYLYSNEENDTTTLLLNHADYNLNTYLENQLTSYLTGNVEFEYNRLKAAQAATTTRLVSDDVKSIQVDNDSGYAVIVTGTFVNVMDIKTGLIYATDEVYENNLNHSDIISMPESVTPHYLLGGSTTIEQVAPQTTVLNGGVPLTENQGPSALVLNPFFVMNL